MDIAYYKKYEPIDGKWYITEELGSGAFGTVFEIERRDFTNDKSALKIITIPSSPNEVRSYREENYDLDEKSVSSYFYGFVEEFTKEFALMTKLKGQNNVVRIEDYDVKEHKGEVGWDIFIRMELLTPMNKYFRDNPPKTRDVIKLGIDICKALEVCQKFNIVHRDIKPSNIFVSDAGEYKLGDFGVARTLEKTSSGLSKKGTYTYMAPEVYKGDAYGSNVDIYSLGIVMYKLLNNNMEPYKQGRTHEDDEKALVARLKGEPMSKPANADGRLAEIILKACAFNPKDRYESPLQMREELENILYSENEEKIIYAEGEVLEFVPTDIPGSEEPDTSGIFDEKLKDDGPTRGIFDEKPVVSDDKDKFYENDIDESSNEEKNKPMETWKKVLLAIFGLLLFGCMMYGIFGGTVDEIPNYENSWGTLEYEARVEFVDKAGYVLLNDFDIATLSEGKDDGGYYIRFDFSQAGIEKLIKYVNEKAGETVDITINNETVSKLTINGTHDSIQMYGPDANIENDGYGSAGSFEKGEFDSIINLIHTTPELVRSEIDGYRYLGGLSEMPDWYIVGEVAVKGNQVAFSRDDGLVMDAEGKVTPTFVTVFTADDDGNLIDVRDFTIFDTEQLAEHYCKELNDFSEGTNSFAVTKEQAEFCYYDNVMIQIFAPGYFQQEHGLYTLDDVIDWYNGWDINYLD